MPVPGGARPWARPLILGSGGLLAIVRGLAYLPTADPPATNQLMPIESWAPISVWAALWMTVGVILLAAIFIRRLSIVGMPALTGLLTTWGTAYVVAWAALGFSRAWVTGSLFLMAAVWSGVLSAYSERQ